MARPQFSEMLISRRRQLGLSIKQASTVLKLKEQVLVAFEEGDYEAIPKSGYAQGMLSSYARYLGLNAREIVDLFLQESFEYTNGTTSHELRRRTRDTRYGREVEGYDLINEEESRPAAYVQPTGLLPTSGGIAGDMGAFATTSKTLRREESASEVSVPLVGSSSQIRSSTPSTYSYAQYTHGHAYNDSSTIEQVSRSRSGKRRSLDLYTPDTAQDRYESDGSLPYGSTQLGMRRSEITTQRVDTSQYRDDLRYDDRASAYQSSASIMGRQSLHNSMRSVDRPNVRRRRDTSRRRDENNNGIVGALLNFFSNSSNIIALVVLALGIALTVVIISSVSSCVASRGASERPIASTETDAQESTAAGVQGTRVPVVSPEDEQTDEDTQAVDNQPSYEEVKVDVSVDEGELSWIQIDMDGATLISETITGPWSSTYYPKQEFTIQVGNSLATTVLKNGELVMYDYKASGVGSITIVGSGEPLQSDTAQEVQEAQVQEAPAG